MMMANPPRDYRIPNSLLWPRRWITGFGGRMLRSPRKLVSATTATSFLLERRTQLPVSVISLLPGLDEGSDRAHRPLEKKCISVGVAQECRLVQRPLV